MLGGIPQPPREDKPMKPFLMTAGIFGILFFVAAGAFKVMLGGGAVDYGTLTGPELYGKLCQQCHHKRGIGGAGNSYAGKRDYWDKESLLEYIANPAKVKAKTPHLQKSRKSMPAIPRSVPTEARERLVLHVIQLMDSLK